MNAQDPIRSKRVPRFVEEYAKDRNGTQAAIRAGFAASNAENTAWRLVNDPQVQVLIAAEMARVSKEANIQAADVLREWLDVATADPSKLMRVRRVNCRHCWGVAHQFQWKAREYAEACDEELIAAEKGKRLPALPDCSGGFGYSRVREPNPACPECDGEGLEDTYIADIETLTGPERKLYAGIKQTRNGPEVIMRDQDKARDNLAKYLGLLIERKELTGKDGAPLAAPTTIVVCGPDD